MSHHHRTYRLVNNRIVIVRSAQPGDAPLLHAMNCRLSRASLYSRYQRHHEPTLQEAEELCNLSAEEGITFVIVLNDPDEMIIGYGFYIHDSSTTVEPAIVVEDNFQGLGLGKLLGYTLAQHAVEHGVAAFNIVTLTANEQIARIVKGTGLPTETSYSYGVRETRIDLTEQALNQKKPTLGHTRQIS